jgi:2'-5' RNA ligase
MTQLPDHPRLFVAVELPGAVRQALDHLQHELQRRALRGLRWVRPEGIHLTLKFLGETPRDKLDTIEEALTGSTAGIAPHELSLGRLGTFGSRNAPRVLWVDLAGDVETLQRLQEQVERALVPLGFPRENRGFSAHLTLARVGPESARDVAGPLAEATGSVSASPTRFEASEVALMMSKLGPGGAVYTQLKAFPLAG